MEDVEKLADFLRKRNAIDREIAGIIQRPAEKGHIAEWIASQVFPIQLNEDANRDGYDGVFKDGDLKGKKVDVKFHPVNQRILDLKRDVSDDVYLLVFTGPYRPAGPSKGKERPYRITNVYLFNRRELCNLLGDRVKKSEATSVRTEYWEKAEIYPEDRVPYNIGMKGELLALFSLE